MPMLYEGENNDMRFPNSANPWWMIRRSRENSRARGNRGQGGNGQDSEWFDNMQKLMRQQYNLDNWMDYNKTQRSWQTEAGHDAGDRAQMEHMNELMRRNAGLYEPGQDGKPAQDVPGGFGPGTDHRYEFTTRRGSKLAYSVSGIKRGEGGAQPTHGPINVPNGPGGNGSAHPGNQDDDVWDAEVVDDEPAPSKGRAAIMPPPRGEDQGFPKGQGETPQPIGKAGYVVMRAGKKAKVRQRPVSLAEVQKARAQGGRDTQPEVMPASLQPINKTSPSERPAGYWQGSNKSAGKTRLQQLEEERGPASPDNIDLSEGAGAARRAELHEATKPKKKKP
jgi:hypothetical protein